MNNNQIISWKAHEYKNHMRSRGWFLNAGLIGGAAIIFSIILGNIMFAVFLALALFLFFVYQIRTPKELDFSIAKRGIKAYDRFFEYAHLQSFWIFEHENGENELSLLSQKNLMPHLKIPLGNTDPDEIREILKQYLPEEHQEESLIDVFARQFGL